MPVVTAAVGVVTVTSLSMVPLAKLVSFVVMVVPLANVSVVMLTDCVGLPSAAHMRSTSGDAKRTHNKPMPPPRGRSARKWL